MALRPNPTALISVTEKTGIVEFAQALIALGFRILASGGTARALTEGWIPVVDISTIVGPPILDHRVATLSREMHAGLLARVPEDEQEMATLGYQFVDLVCVDFYRLEDTIAKLGADPKAVTKATDIGGPAMARSAAKGDRVVICVPEDRTPVIQWLQAGMPDAENFINYLAAKAEFVVSRYCAASAIYRGQGTYDAMFGTRALQLRYGENGHQAPAFHFATSDDDPLALHKFGRIEQTPPGFVNMRDLDRLLQTMTHIAGAFEINYGYVPLIAVGCKHGNPCGAAYGNDSNDVMTKMVLGDPVAIFGGMVMTNFPITVELAELLLSTGGKRVLDGVIAPSFDTGVFDTVKRRDERCRLYHNTALGSLSRSSVSHEMMRIPVRGGFLLQPGYTHILNLDDDDLQCSNDSCRELPTDVLLGWGVCATSNSNTITLVKDGMLIGNGVGQQDRKLACRFAIERAEASNHDLKDALAVSDSFFPFPDGPQLLAKAGVRTIFATRGSKNDQIVVNSCIVNRVDLWTLPDAKARMFFGH